MVLVKLLLEQIRNMRSTDKRLFRKYEGPLPVLSKVGKCSYKVDIPAWMKVHPVFHVSNLKPYQSDAEDQSRNQPTRQHVELKTHKPKEVEEILAERVVDKFEQGRGDRLVTVRQQQYLVKWKKMGEEEICWENVEALKKFKQKIEDFKLSSSLRQSSRVPTA